MSEIGRIFLLTFAFVFINPVFWLVVLLVFFQYRRVANLERAMFGRVINPVGQQVLTSLGLGVAGGFVVSAVLLFLGLSLEHIGLYFIWPVALLLLLFNPRFLCFSYAGGIVAAAALLARFISGKFPHLARNALLAGLVEINIPALLVLIALLHLLEAVLIYFSGHRGSSPIYLKKPGGQVVGGFSLQRFWPLPLTALLVTVVLPSEAVGVSMPEWWPIIKPSIQPGLGEILQYAIIPVAAGLGYADLALSSSPREKSVYSARMLALYSVALLLVALASQAYPPLAVFGALLAPLGHELLIVYGNRKEFARQPRYASGEPGVGIMMVLDDSPAARAGLKEGDRILRVNGMPVNSHEDFFEKVKESYFMVFLEGTRGGAPFSVVLNKGGFREQPDPDSLPVSRSRADLYRGVRLGLILVPPAASTIYVEVKKPDLWKWLREKLAWNHR